jgi:hypothetical protein
MKSISLELELMKEEENERRNILKEKKSMGNARKLIN